MSEAFIYPGQELELFHHAKNWKKYFSKTVRPYINGHVLEVGAGIGSTTLLLNNGSATSWLMLEPDDSMYRSLQEKKAAGEFPANTNLTHGNISILEDRENFDTIIYIDVLEHIEKDKAELAAATRLLKPGGHIIVLSPAFQFLFSPFDKAIGHYRRYTRKKIREISPAGTTLISNRYYDTVGFFASAMNKAMLRQQYPSLKQVLFWDRWMIPVSRITDNLLFHSFGKSIIAAWKKSPASKQES